MEAVDLGKLRENSTYQCVGLQVHPALEKLEYPRNDIIYIRDLGQGAFGRVFQVLNFHFFTKIDINSNFFKI